MVGVGGGSGVGVRIGVVFDGSGRRRCRRRHRHHHHRHHHHHQHHHHHHRHHHHHHQIGKDNFSGWWQSSLTPLLHGYLSLPFLRKETFFCLHAHPFPQENMEKKHLLFPSFAACRTWRTCPILAGTSHPVKNQRQESNTIPYKHLMPGNR